MSIAVVLDILAILFTLAGIGFMFISALGVFRMPDIYHRLHTSSKASTIGLLGLLIGAILYFSLEPDGTIVVIKALITLLFAFIALPTGSHILAKAAHRAGVPTWSQTLSDELDADGPTDE